MKRIECFVIAVAALAGCTGGAAGPAANVPAPSQSNAAPTPGPSAVASPARTPTPVPISSPSSSPVPSESPTVTAGPASTPAGQIATAHFVVNGSTVTGSGTTSTTQSDRFAGASGSTYQITVQSGAKLIAYCDNTANATAQTTCSSAANELIAVGAGSLTNEGTLNSEPVPTETAGGKAYALTDSVVAITNPGSVPTVVDNYGSIGDDSLSNCSYCGPPGYYGQGDAAAILIAGQATVTNESSGYLSGYNAFFSTSGTGVFNNYGVVFGVNDGLLTGYAVNNFQNAGIVTGVAGFANIHNYGNVVNDGYILGADYAILAQNGTGTIDDYGGPAIAGIADFQGNPVYDGEISAIPRNATTPEPDPTPIGTPALSGAAIEVIAASVTIRLYDRVIGGSTYFPLVRGPIDGGLNGSFAGATTSIPGATLDFEFPDLPASNLSELKAAVAASRTSNANGTFFTGDYTLTYGGVTHPYEWANVPNITIDGVAQ